MGDGLERELLVGRQPPEQEQAGNRLDTEHDGQQRGDAKLRAGRKPQTCASRDGGHRRGDVPDVGLLQPGKNSLDATGENTQPKQHREGHGGLPGFRQQLRLFELHHRSPGQVQGYQPEQQAHAQADQGQKGQPAADRLTQHGGVVLSGAVRHAVGQCIANTQIKKRQHGRKAGHGHPDAKPLHAQVRQRQADAEQGQDDADDPARDAADD